MKRRRKKQEQRSSELLFGSGMGRRVFVDTIGVLDAGKKCEPATSMSQP